MSNKNILRNLPILLVILFLFGWTSSSAPWVTPNLFSQQILLWIKKRNSGCFELEKRMKYLRHETNFFFGRHDFEVTLNVTYICPHQPGFQVKTQLYDWDRNLIWQKYKDFGVSLTRHFSNKSICMLFDLL